MLHGEQRELFDLEFVLPSVVADHLASGQADIGIVPVAHFLRQDLEVFRGTGIACHGAVRSILLISKVPFEEIRTLAADAASRSSVMLTRIILEHRYGASPKVVTRPANLATMIEECDAALIIGDPALLIHPETLPFRCLDLGAEWTSWTGLPMVFAVWAGPPGVRTPELEKAFIDSAKFGISKLDDIVAAEHAKRGVSPEMVRKYFTEHIVMELGDHDYQGMAKYLEYARQLEKVTV
jgi:predicted solute-binding protein